MKVDCRTCKNWFDNELNDKFQLKDVKKLFYGCKIHGQIENYTQMEECPDYTPHDEPFIICKTCGLPVPRTCVLFGECANCTDTDMFCLEHCTGGEWKKYCTHWVRLTTEGKEIIKKDRVYNVTTEAFKKDGQKHHKRLYEKWKNFVKKHKNKDPFDRLRR